MKAELYHLWAIGGPGYKKVKQAALDKVMEECYDRIETDEKLRSLVDTVGNERKAY